MIARRNSRTNNGLSRLLRLDSIASPAMLLLLILLLILLLNSAFAENLEPDRVQLTSVSPGATLALTCTIIRPDADASAERDGRTDAVDTDFMNYVWRREFGKTRREEIFLGSSPTQADSLIQ